MKAKAAVSANGGSFQHTLEHGVDTAATAAHHTIDSVSDAARPALDHMVSGAHGAVDRAGVAAAHAAGTLGMKGDQWNDSGKKIVERAGFYVRQHPVAFLGMAVAAGYFLSRLLSPR
ncbi:MAG TPA: hypothetical protein VI566_09195 [Xanthomonadales bacterium]|nr:hypothetical protein [Xanthomonadales bacterium]